MYLYFHLEFKICCIHIFSKRTLMYFFLNTATIAFNFICENKCYLKKNSLQRAAKPPPLESATDIVAVSFIGGGNRSILRKPPVTIH